MIRHRGARGRSPDRLLSVLLALAIMIGFTGICMAMQLAPDVSFRDITYVWTEEQGRRMAWTDEDATTIFTVRSVIALEQDILHTTDAIYLATLAGPAQDTAPFVELVWERDRGGWGLGWGLKLRDVEAPDSTLGQPDPNMTTYTISNAVPLPGHEYEVLFSYDSTVGQLSFLVTDQTENMVVVKGSWRVASNTSAVRIGTGFLGGALPSDNTGAVTLDRWELLPHYLPLDNTWSLATTAGPSGTLLPVRRFEVDSDVVISVNVPDGLQGAYRLLYEKDGAQPQLLRSVKEPGEHRFSWPGSQFPIGEGRIRLDYIVGDDVLLTGSRPISVGKITVSVAPLTREGDELHGTALVRAGADLIGLPFRLEARLFEWVWDSERRRYEHVQHGIEPLFSGELDVQSGLETEVPFTLRLPDRDGNWEVTFEADSSLDVSLSSLGGKRLYASGPNYSPRGIADEKPGSIRVCTYNVLGFQGWPQEVARAAFGSSTTRRLEHFAGVLEELDCDIIGIQEGASFNWLSRLAQATGRNGALFNSPTQFPGAVITRFPIVAERDFTVGQRSPDVPFSRTAGAALLDIDGEEVWVVNIHAHPNRQELRDAEAVLLSKEIDGLLDTTPSIIVLGDFNSVVGTVIHDALEQRGFMNVRELAPGGATYTMTDLDGIGRHAIDHIYVSEPLLGRVAASKVVTDHGFHLPLYPGPDVWVHSDHLPVMVEMEW